MAQDQWSYRGHTGPDYWPDMYEAASGHRQSPINILSYKAKQNATLGSLKYTYVKDNSQSIENTGHSFNVSVDSSGSALSGGPLKYKYKLAGFHAHWGLTDDAGSEHTVNRMPYPAELHMVHWNSDLYDSLDEAKSQHNGLAVLGVFLQVGSEHSEFQTLLTNFKKIPFKGNSVKLEEGFDPECLLPDNIHDYWSYEGSLTTPPCYESVTWILFKDAIEISGQQLGTFRTLHVNAGHKHHHNDHRGSIDENMLDNYRPTQPVFEREITSTF